MGGHCIEFLGIDTVQLLFKGCFDCFKENILLRWCDGEKACREWAVPRRYVKCFVRPVISILDWKSFIKELVLKAISCLAKLEFAEEKRNWRERWVPFQEVGMRHAKDLWQVMIKIQRSQIHQGKREELYSNHDWNKSSKQSTKSMLSFLVAKAILFFCLWALGYSEINYSPVFGRVRVLSTIFFSP